MHWREKQEAPARFLTMAAFPRGDLRFDSPASASAEKSSSSSSSSIQLLTGIHGILYSHRHIAGMKERCSSRSLSRQLQAALHSSQGEAYLQQLGISPSSGNGANAGNSEQPDASSSTSRERSEDQHATRTTKDVSIQQLLAPLESSKLSKDLGGPRPKEEPQPSQGTALPSDQNRHDSETAAKKAQAKAAKAERDARMREGAAKYQEILAKGPPKPKPGLLERIAIIKAEKVGRETNVEDASDTAMQPVEAALDKRQRAQDKPPVWSTSLQDLRTADELCPDAETKKGKVGVKLSRGKIARAVLFADSTSTQNQRLDGRGEVYFDVVVSMSKKRSPVGGTQQNGQAGNTGLTATSRRSKKLGDPDRQPSASEMLEAAAEPAPPPRRSFMERRMARGWAYQQTPRDVVVPQSAPQSELKPMPLPEPVFRDPTTDDSALGPPEPIGKQEASTDAVEAHEVSMSSVTAPDEVAHPSQALPVPKASKEARDASIEGLVEAYRLETPVYLYLAGKCKCTGAADAATSCSGGESCGALRLLPCKLPNRVEALGVGWTTIVDLEVLVLPQPTIRFYLRIDSSLEKEPWWWLPVPPTLRGWKLPRNPPSNTHQPAAHRPDGLLSALACTSCHATVLRQHWQGWTCAHCSLSVPATALSSDYDVDWGKMPILTEGPRMDNGRVLCIPPISRTDIKTWDDGIKVVDYLLPAAKSQSAGMILRDAGTGEAVEQRVVQSSGSDVRLHHFLSCGDWRRTCDKLLQDLLDPTMP